jgi:hypothetical protein
VNVSDLLSEAERELEHHDPGTAGIWPHAAAVLIRQALETTLDVFWGSRAAALLDASFRDRWLCLPAYIGVDPAARAADFAWTALSQACHHRAYDVGLTEDELRAHLAAARAFAVLVAARLRPG